MSVGRTAGWTLGGLLLGRFGLSGVFWGSALLAAAWALSSIRLPSVTPEQSVPLVASQAPTVVRGQI